MGSDPRDEEIREWRAAFARGIGHCEWCGSECGWLDCHEIARGTSRQNALTEPSCILVLGRTCHDILHQSFFERQIGLAILWHRRPHDYSLSTYRRVTGKNWPEQEEIDPWIRRLSISST